MKKDTFLNKGNIIVLAAAASAVAMLASCSTTEGFGRDLKKVGSRIEARAESTGGTEPYTPAPAPAAPATAY